MSDTKSKDKKGRKTQKEAVAPKREIRGRIRMKELRE
jgi:hypothetical protein